MVGIYIVGIYCMRGGASQAVLVVKNLPANAGDAGLTPGSERSPGGRIPQPAPVCLPGGSHEQRSLAGYSPEGCRVRYD